MPIGLQGTDDARCDASEEAIRGDALNGDPELSKVALEAVGESTSWIDTGQMLTSGYHRTSR